MTETQSGTGTEPLHNFVGWDLALAFNDNQPPVELDVWNNEGGCKMEVKVTKVEVVPLRRGVHIHKLHLRQKLQSSRKNTKTITEWRCISILIIGIQHWSRSDIWIFGT